MSMTPGISSKARTSLVSTTVATASENLHGRVMSGMQKFCTPDDAALRNVLASAAIASGTSVSVLDDTHDSPVLITTPSQSHSAVEDLERELKEEKRKNDLLHQRIQALTAVKEKSLRKKQKLSQICTGMSNSVSDAEHPDVVDLPDSSCNNQRLSTITVDVYLEGSSEKEHYCFYCFKRISKMARHLTLCHRMEDEVGKILLLPKKSD
jgi:hypothetical protein